MSLTVGVTGGTGFIGKQLVKALIKQGFNVISFQRSKSNNENVETRYFDLSKINTINEELLKGVDVLIHTAALVHNLKANSNSYKSMNYDATKQLFYFSKKLRVKKFIFLSTVAVYGMNSHNSTIDINSKTKPNSHYAKSKLNSEIDILTTKNNKMIVCVIRLPLVLGKNAPGNYGYLDKISRSKIPLPFGLTNNKRSVISLNILVKVLIKACKYLNAYQGLNLLAERKPISTKQLLINLRSSYSMPPNLLPIPKFLMKIFLTLIGKREIYEKLYEDLVFKGSIDEFV